MHCKTKQPQSHWLLVHFLLRSCIANVPAFLVSPCFRKALHCLTPPPHTHTQNENGKTKEQRWNALLLSSASESLISFSACTVNVAKLALHLPPSCFFRSQAGWGMCFYSVYVFLWYIYIYIHDINGPFIKWCQAESQASSLQNVGKHLKTPWDIR